MSAIFETESSFFFHLAPIPRFMARSRSARAKWSIFLLRPPAAEWSCSGKKKKKLLGSVLVSILRPSVRPSVGRYEKNSFLLTPPFLVVASYRGNPQDSFFTSHAISKLTSCSPLHRSQQNSTHSTALATKEFLWGSFAETEFRKHVSSEKKKKMRDERSLLLTISVQRTKEGKERTEVDLFLPACLFC